MTLLPRGVKVHLAFGFIDMRKGIDVADIEIKAVDTSQQPTFPVLLGDTKSVPRPRGGYLKESSLALGMVGGRIWP
jgi:hypothetical protein